MSYSPEYFSTVAAVFVGLAALFCGVALAQSDIEGAQGLELPPGQVAPNESAEPSLDSETAPSSFRLDVKAALSAADPQASQRLRLSVGDRVFFAADSPDLGLKARVALHAQARWLITTDSKAVIVGHSDDAGSEQDNLALGLRRAETVRDRLIEAGVQAEKLRVVSAGRSQRVAVCAEPYCRVHNRRAVIEIVRQFEP